MEGVINIVGDVNDFLPFLPNAHLHNSIDARWIT